MLIYLIRHPPPRDIEGLCYGRLDVVVEPQEIMAAAESVFARLSRRTLARARIYSSPSSRCLGLARRLAAPRDPISAEDLAEISFGSWEGMAWDALQREQIDAWANDSWGYRPGGGESAQMVAMRWDRWLQRARQDGEDSLVAVTHAGVIRIALLRAGRLDLPSAIRAPIAYGSIHLLELE